MSKCKGIKEMKDAINRGEDIERVIPFNMDGYPMDCYKEALALYIKYGKNKDRLEFCKKRLKEIL